MSYKKLVRDKIIDLIKSKGETPIYHTLTDEEYIKELHKKLFEEANEFVEEDNPEELADLLEVLYSIAKVKNIDLEEVERIRQKKHTKRGGFDKKIYLEDVEELKKIKRRKIMEEKDLEKEELKQQKQEMYRHSMSHVLAKAIKSLYSNVKFAIGPAIDNGFYYDIDMEESIKPEDFKKIEDKMNEIICNNEDFVRFELSKEEALEKFKDNPYKVELINELPEGELITMYRTGDDFYDLCRGPHVENTKFLRGFAYKINRVSGAYWRGSEKNKMLQRVYVYGFLDKNDLKAYIHHC